MENYMLDESINNDFLSQSYSQGIERITGTNNFNNFGIPKKVLEIRKKVWKCLFDKYFEEQSSDIVNIATCELEDISEEELSCGQRIRMYKPASFIQYWINTGKLPYKEFLNKNEDIGSSLSEKESVSSKQLFSSNKNSGQEYRNDSSSSSVDTAVYILSNANITKKTDTIAIMEGAKCLNIKSSKNMKDIKANDKTEHIRILRIDQSNCSDNNVNTNVPNAEMGPTEHIVSKIHTQPSTIISTNTLQPNISQYLSCEKIDKIDTLKSRPKRSDVQNIHDIAFIFQQFDKTTQRLSGNDKEDIILDENEVNRNISDVKQVSASTSVTEMINNNTSMTLQRKKLYTGRDSPIDLITTNEHSVNRLSEIHNLHPALDTDCIIARKTFLSRKNKNEKCLSLVGRKSLDFKKKRKKRNHSKLIKNNKNNNKNSTISSYQSLSSFHSNSDMQDNIPHRRLMIQENNDTNNSCVKDRIYKQDLASLNLNPVVLLERIKPSFERHKSNFVKNDHNMQENNVYNKCFLKTSIKLRDQEHQREIEDLQSRISNTSTILICECEKDILQEEISNDSSFNLKLSIGSVNSSAVSIEEKVDKLSSSKDTLMIQTRKPRILTVASQVSNENDDIQQKKVLDKSKMYLHGTNKMGNINFKELKVSLLRINKNYIDTMVNSQILDKNYAIQQKRVLRESEARSSNLYKTNNKDNMKLREIKVVLERLPTNICLKKSITDINLYSDKKNILQSTSLHDNKIESSIKTVSLTDKEVFSSIKRRKINNSSLEMRMKSKKNDKLNDTSDSEYENRVSDKVESNSANYKCSILSFTSSDEDDFVQLSQESNKKRLKRNCESIDNKTLNEANININNRNLNTVIFSSKKVTPRKIGNGIIDLNKQNKKFQNVININNSRHLDTVTKRNKIDRKNIIFQTKTDYTDFLCPEESNNYTTCKGLKSSSMRDKSRYSNHINKERSFSIRNRHIINSSNSLNSSIEEYNITNQSHNMLFRSTSNKKVQVSKQLANEEFNDISLRNSIKNTKKNNKSSFINDKQDTSVEKEIFVNTSFERNNLSNLLENKQIPDKSKNSVIIERSNIKPMVTKLRFQTKNYYDSDSS